MKTLMRNGRDRRSENPFLGHAKKERVSLFGTDQRITSGPAARRPHSKAEYMTAPERFADSQIPLAPRAPSIHDPGLVTLGLAALAAGACSLLMRSGGSASARMAPRTGGDASDPNYSVDAARRPRNTAPVAYPRVRRGCWVGKGVEQQSFCGNAQAQHYRRDAL